MRFEAIATWFAGCAAGDIRTLPEDDAVWLWDSQPLDGDLVPVGEPVDLSVWPIFRLGLSTAPHGS